MHLNTPENPFLINWTDCGARAVNSQLHVQSASWAAPAGCFAVFDASSAASEDRWNNQTWSKTIGEYFPFKARSRSQLL